MRNLLNPILYTRRNKARTLPLVLVVLLSVVMVASVVTVVRSINLTVYTLYGYNRFTTGLTPRNALAIDDDIVAKMQALPEMGTLAPTHSYSCLLRTIFGRLIFPFFGMNPADRDLLLARCHIRLSAGHLPRPGEPDVAVSEAVARNLGVKLGDIILRPDSEDAYAPVPMRLVGLLQGDVWVGLTDKTFVDANSPFTWQGYLAFARTPGQQRSLDRAMARVNDRSRARIWQFAYLVRETQNSLANLYLMLNIVIAVVVTVISFVCGLLSNIYFTQRLPEVATLAAIGYQRPFLLRRAVGETVLVCLLGWLAGAGVTISFMSLIRILVLEPRGLLLNAIDLPAYAFTAPLPIVIVLFTLLTLSARLARLDPISIIERRG